MYKLNLLKIAPFIAVNIVVVFSAMYVGSYFTEPEAVPAWLEYFLLMVMLVLYGATTSNFIDGVNAIYRGIKKNKGTP